MGALRSGCGLVTVHLPASERAVIHCTCPSAMVDSEPQGHFSILPSVLEKYTAVGCGCGLGRHPETAEALSALLDAYRKPMVLDADALNIIAASPELLESVPEGSVFTPHLGELRRLTGAWDSREEMLEKAVALAVRTRSCVVVKGPHSAVIAPDGQVSCNTTGNPGMATGGSGDVLTGLLTGLLASGYPAFDAARLGVWLHRGYRGLALRTERYEQPGHSRLSRRGVPVSGKILIKRLPGGRMRQAAGRIRSAAVPSWRRGSGLYPILRCAAILQCPAYHQKSFRLLSGIYVLATCWTRHISPPNGHSAPYPHKSSRCLFIRHFYKRALLDVRYTSTPEVWLA